MPVTRETPGGGAFTNYGDGKISYKNYHQFIFRNVENTNNIITTTAEGYTREG